ncbi:MAG: helix-turn-helix domain-containing protein [Micrococcaceae bacterium]
MDPQIITHLSVEERRCLSLSYCKSIKELSRLTIKDLEQQAAWFKMLTTEQQNIARTTVHLGIKSFDSWLKNDISIKESLVRTFGTRPLNILHSLNLEYLLQICQSACKVVSSKSQILCPYNTQGFKNLVAAFCSKAMFCASEAFIESSQAHQKTLETNLVETIIAQRGTEAIFNKLKSFSWKEKAPCTAVIGKLSMTNTATVAEKKIQDYLSAHGVKNLTAFHRDTLVILLSNFKEIRSLLSPLQEYFENGTIVFGPIESSFKRLEYATHCAFAGYLCSQAWLKADSLIDAQDLIPERIILGDKKARDYAIQKWYKPLKDVDPKLLLTTETYLECAFSLEGTAREIGIHSNTVRYRLDRVAEVVNLDFSNIRDIYTLKIALTTGKLAERKSNYASTEVTKMLSP